MQTKPNDTLYCGVDSIKIQQASPDINYGMFKELTVMIRDRYRIHKRKDVKGLPKPWTNNPIMQQYKFTNVRREHDKQTRHLLKSIVHNNKLTLEDKIVNCFLFRAWNNYDTFHDFGLPAPSRLLYNPSFKESIRPRYQHLSTVAVDRLWFSSAYNQGGTKQAWRYLKKDKTPLEKDIPLRPFHIGVWLSEQNIANRLLHSKNQQECFEIIKEVRGFADFLAYQVFVDLTYIPEFPYSENEFVVAGSGCKSGLNWLFINKDGMTDEECLFWLRDNWSVLCYRCNIPWNSDKLFSDLPEYDRCMNVMSLENCFCEFSKYMRAKTGQGRPRVTYKGV